MEKYQIQLEQFQGPLDKLLELIEEKKLPITQVSLAEITAGFFDFLKKIQAATQLDNENIKRNSRILADFLVIASKLLLIKSKALLPNLVLTEEEEQDIKELEERLKRYQEFKPAINYLKKLIANNNVSVSRPLFLGLSSIFYPAKNIDKDNLFSALENVFNLFFIDEKEEETVSLKVIKLEEKIEEIISRIRNQEIIEFDKLKKEKSKTEIIVLFLALLHLLKEEIILVEQSKEFDKIIIKPKQTN